MPTSDLRAHSVLGELGIRPLSARSVLLSVLLGQDSPELEPDRLLALALGYGVGESTARVALSRMVSAGDVTRSGTHIALSARLLERRSRQAEAIAPYEKSWNGGWILTVIHPVGLPAARRLSLRGQLAGRRMAEVRDGVWTRPDNLSQASDAEVEALTLTVVGPLSVDSSVLAGQLWDLSAWSSRARSLIAVLRTGLEPGPRLAVGAAIVRHLVEDPVLPSALVPPDWPGDGLRAAYARFRDEDVIV